MKPQKKIITVLKSKFETYILSKVESGVRC